MESVLRTQSWCRPAQKILEHTLKLSCSNPTIMHIRHTERERATPGGDPLSTEQGLRAAYEFGASLPTGRRYRVWHTVVERTRETSLAIKVGLESNQAECTLAGPIPVNTILDPAGFHDTQPRTSSSRTPTRARGPTLNTGYVDSTRPPWCVHLWSLPRW